MPRRTSDIFVKVAERWMPDPLVIALLTLAPIYLTALIFFRHRPCQRSQSPFLDLLTPGSPDLGTIRHDSEANIERLLRESDSKMSLLADLCRSRCAHHLTIDRAAGILGCMYAELRINQSWWWLPREEWVAG